MTWSSGLLAGDGNEPGLEERCEIREREHQVEGPAREKAAGGTDKCVCSSREQVGLAPKAEKVLHREARASGPRSTRRGSGH